MSHLQDIFQLQIRHLSTQELVETAVEKGVTACHLPMSMVLMTPGSLLGYA